jgi:hypothetical protein
MTPDTGDNSMSNSNDDEHNISLTMRAVIRCQAEGLPVEEFLDRIKTLVKLQDECDAAYEDIVRWKHVLAAVRHVPCIRSLGLPVSMTWNERSSN